MRTFYGPAARIIPLLLVPAMSLAKERWTNPPELRLGLHDVIQATIDNNVNVRLLRERIARAQADTNVLWSNVAGYELPELTNGVREVLGG